MQEKATDPTTGETKSRMDWVKEALMGAKGVFVKSAKKDSEGNQVVPPSVVTLLRFGGGQGRGAPPGKGSMILEGMNGESWQRVKPIVSGADYDRQVGLLGKPLGWTHLYNAVDVAVGDLLQGKTYLASFLRSQKHLMPTIIVLTDGFNNTFYSQKCKDNTAKLSELLGSIEEARGRKGSLSQRPTVYTVGFGKPLPIPEIVQSSTTVDPLDLCGSQGEERISTGGRGIALERDYIDGGSLRLIAHFGGGKSFVDPNPAKLKEAFLSAAPPRYRWYTYKYRMKSTELRSPFVTEIVMNRFAAASSKVKWYPSSWIDGPSSTPVYEEKKGANGVTWTPTGWSRPSSVRHASGLLLLLLWILMTLSFLGPALFNGRRAVTRRSRKTS
jgi:hypothetical protein